MIVDEPVEDSDSQPCPICGDDDNEDVLMICDGCEVASHTYCVGLDSVPSGPWYCVQCESQRAISSEPQQSRPRRTRRTRGDQRRNRSRRQMHDFHWARVWQSVWDQLNLDLDFPWENEDAAERVLQQQRRVANNRREFNAWERRFRVAERQGGLNRFQETAPALFEIGRGWPSRPRQRVETPEPESLDEVRAWNAFERAKELQDNPNSNRRKRKSPTASPMEPQSTEPERKLKRPRTKRSEALAGMADQGGESSRNGRPIPTDSDTFSRPTFLQSLLKEVEDSSTPSQTNGAYRASVPSSTAADMSSSGPSSPANSPLSSSPSSSRPSSTTPPPNNHTSRHSSPDFSPLYSPVLDSDSIQQPQISRHGRSLTYNSRRNHTSSSPTRLNLPLSIKSDLQKMVRALLKPFYRKREVSKEEYTNINCRISRMLYEQAGALTTLDSDTKTRLATLAREQVNIAVASLKDTRSNEANDSSSG